MNILHPDFHSWRLLSHKETIDTLRRLSLNDHAIRVLVRYEIVLAVVQRTILGSQRLKVLQGASSVLPEIER